MFPRYSSKFYERFEKCIDKNGPVPAHRPELGPCWVWNGCIRKPDGYGQVFWEKAGGKRPHRIYWEYINGPIPNRLQVLHACDNPPCLRISHLFLGTQYDNIHDMMDKGRSKTCGLYGIKNPNSKLSEDDVREIINWPKYRGSGEHMALVFGVNRSVISQVRHRKRWIHID